MNPSHTGPESLEAKITAWAKSRGDVRTALLIGSRASPQGARDRLSDHDVLLFLDAESPLAERDDWIETFGEPLLVLHETTEHRGERVPTRLIQYRGGDRVDFTLSREDLLRAIVDQEALPDWLGAGYRVLLDRDGLADRLQPPSAMAYVPRPPSGQEYQGVVREFWWETLYVAKHVGRGELLPARYSLETVLRYRCLLPMLEWYVQVSRDWEQSLGVRGSGLRWLLEPEDRKTLDRTYAGEKLEEHREALEAMCDLFGRAARSVARNRRLTYPAELERETRRLLER